MKDKKAQNRANFVIAMSYPCGEIKLEKLDSYDIARYLALCKPFMDAVETIKPHTLYPHRVDNVVKRFAKTKREKKLDQKITSTKNINLFKSDKTNAELAKIYGVSINRIYKERKRILEQNEQTDMD